ncbi:MAG: capsule assembly Wzi family protein [Candidatus Paceibacterota bacterium]
MKKIGQIFTSKNKLNPKPPTLNPQHPLNSSTPKLLNYLILISILTSTLTLTSTSTHAQSLTINDPLEHYLRVIPEDQNAIGNITWNFRSSNSQYAQGELPVSHPWQDHNWFRSSASPTIFSDKLKIYSPSLLLSHNNQLDVGENTGALWQGVGNNTLFSMGIGYENGPLKIAFRPAFVYNQNDFLEITGAPKKPGLSRYAMQLTWIDAPQRFGEESISNFDLGNSVIQLQHYGLRAGISNEHLWIGPSLKNPLILGNNAPGFLHGFLGTQKPYQSKIGQFEFYWFWGGLQESEFFDENPENDRRYITGITMNYSHHAVPGLNVGVARVAYSAARGVSFSAGDLFMAFKPPKEINQDGETVALHDYHVAMTSLFFRWHFPEAGFEAYGEVGVNNDKRTIRDLLAEPELNRAYTIGLLKRFSLPKNMKLVLNTELSTLENSSISSQFRDDRNTWYTDEHVIQGYTQKGQFLGAGIGPGSSAQHAKLSLYHPLGMIGASFTRIAWHEDRLFDNKEYFRSVQFRESARMHALHEIELRYGFHSLLFLPWNLELQADLRLTSLDNRWQRHLKDDKNTNLMFTLRYFLSGWSR